ncbi:MFS transporter [Streptomyces sp. NPDC002671]
MALCPRRCPNRHESVRRVPAPPERPCRNENLRQLWASTATSNLADGMLLSATPLVALTLTRDPLAITAITAMQYLPWLLFSVPLGTLADRVDRVLLLRTASITRALGVGLPALALALALALATGHVHILMLYALSFLFGLAETLYDNTSSALVPLLVEDHQLERANGRLYATYTVANNFAGPPLGGSVFALAVSAPFVLGAAGYVVAALLLAVLPLTHSKRAPGRATTTFVEDLKAGVRGFTGQPLPAPRVSCSGSATWQARPPTASSP